MKKLRFTTVVPLSETVPIATQLFFFAFHAPHGWSIRLRDKSKGEDSTLLASCTKELPALPYDGQLDLTVSFSTDSLDATALIGQLTSLYLNDTS